jgi:hypothetical protein
MWDGRCDVTGDGRQCVFVRIHERLEEQGRGLGSEPLPPKDHGRRQRAARLDARGKDES